MDLKVSTLNVRGLNKSCKRRQLFRWLHQQNADVIFLQETYSSTQTIKIWENEWGGKICASHGSTHSRGVMIMFKPKLDVTIENIIADKNGRYIVAEAILNETKIVFLNIYAPNDTTLQVHFLRDLSQSICNQYINEKVVLGGDFNCALNDLDKRGGRSLEYKKNVIKEFNTLLFTHDLIDTWREKNPNLPGFTWSNPSMKIQCRLDYLFLSKNFDQAISDVKIAPNIFSDHSALNVHISTEDEQAHRGPGFWKFNNSLLTDKTYVDLITKSIPEYVKKYQNLEDKGLLWEMIKMEIRATSIIFAKRKARKKRNEEKELLLRFNSLQEQLRLNFNETTKAEIDRVKVKLARITAIKTRGSVIRSKARWYEFGEKSSKYFYNLEKRNQKKKNITSLKKPNGSTTHCSKEILKEEANFFSKLYETSNSNPNHERFKFFFESDGLMKLDGEMSDSCEGLLTIEECTKVLSSFNNDKTPGSDGLTIEFYRFFWNALGAFVVDSFNYAFQRGSLSISQKLGIITLIPKKSKDLEHLKNWRPISLLNTDYKIATKAIAARLGTVLPSIIHPCQAGYIKGRYIGECIRLISDTMSYTKENNLTGAAVFLDFEKAFDSIEWNYLQKCLEVFGFGPQLRQWVQVFYSDISSCVLNNGFASEHFSLKRGVRQGCPLSGLLFLIGIEILGNAIRNSNKIKGIEIEPGKSIKLAQYADDTTVIVKDPQSILHLFDLLSRFEQCSGLRINETKSELLWLGSYRFRKDKILNLRLSEEPILALGVYFSYDDKLAAQKNFFDKLASLKKTLNIWSSRDISIYGRINIVKTLALSKLTFVCSALDTPDSFTDEVNKIIFDYVWKYKKPRIKKTTILKRKEEGGLNMTDFTLFDKALKLCWVKRLCEEQMSPWKIIPTSLLSNVGGNLLFHCNYNAKNLKLNDQLPAFYKNLIIHWQDVLNVDAPQFKEEVLNQIIWNNRFIKINNVSVFYRNWHLAGIQHFSSLLDDSGKKFLTFENFKNKFNVNCNFLQFYGLLSAIPRQWKVYLNIPDPQETLTHQFAIEKLTCKTIYNSLISHKNLPPPTADKRLIECGYDLNKRCIIYSLPFRVTKEIKLAIFQYKIIHNIFCTNSLLYKMKKNNSPDCPFCADTDQTIFHLFVSCPQARAFWSEFLIWYNNRCKTTATLTKNDIIYGLVDNFTLCLTLNHLVLIGKYFLYKCAINEVRYHFADFIALVQEKIDLEKYIAIKANRQDTFFKKWQFFL